jgi:hypothetical protein
MLALAGSGCATIASYEALVHRHTEFTGSPRCEVRPYREGGGELVVRARLRGVGDVMLTTLLQQKLFDPAESVNLQQRDRVQLDFVDPESCAVLASGDDAATRYVLRSDSPAGTPYRLFTTGPDGTVSQGATVQFPDSVQSRRGLVAFIFLAPLLAIVDVTPIGWLIGLIRYFQMGNS